MDGRPVRIEGKGDMILVRVAGVRDAHALRRVWRRMPRRRLTRQTLPGLRPPHIRVKVGALPAMAFRL